MKQWYILFTAYENSLSTMKKLVKSNLPRGCGAYIPSTIVVGNKYHTNRVYNKPVYPFYLFICCTEQKQLNILRKKMRLLNIEGYFLQNVDGTYATLSSDQIRNMETHKQQSTHIQESQYAIGEEVTVATGPMAGFTGVITTLTDEFVYLSLCTKKGKFIELPILYSDLSQGENK